MPKELIRLWKSFFYSCSGLKSVFISEAAFRTEILLTPFTTGLAIYFGYSPLEQGLLIFAWVLVIIAELFNSAIEAVVDRISTDIHPLSKAAKDIGSAAVLISLVNWALLWLFLVILR